MFSLGIVRQTKRLIGPLTTVLQLSMRNLAQQGVSSQNILNVHIFISEFWFWGASPRFSCHLWRHFQFALLPHALSRLSVYFSIFDWGQKLQSAAMERASHTSVHWAKSGLQCRFLLLFGKMKLNNVELHECLFLLLFFCFFKATFAARYSKAA